MPPLLLFAPAQVKLLLALAAAIAVGYGVLGYGYIARGVQLDRERLNFVKREADINAKLLKREAENRQIERNIAVLLREAKDEHDRTMEAQRVAHADALRRLRDDKPRAALRPAATAPAECVNHAAAASQLSVEDAAFLIDFAAEADGLVAQLTEAQRHIGALNTAYREATEQARDIDARWRRIYEAAVGK